jgi:hypothetical protein
MNHKEAYWEQRKQLRYYHQVLCFARDYVPDGGRVLDVGGRDCHYITWFDWFDSRQVIDLRQPPTLPGVVSTAGDFMTFEVAEPFDLVLCLQVLEHLEEPEPFCRKLLEAGRRVIISVPYKWRRGMCRYHKQDPVDEDKLLLWTGQAPTASAIVADNGLRRLVAVYQGWHG